MVSRKLWVATRASRVVSFSTSAMWKTSDTSLEYDEEVFTEGVRMQSGAGVFSAMHSATGPCGIPGFAYVLEAEVPVILEAFPNLRHDPRPTHNVVILTKSQAGIETLYSIATSGGHKGARQFEQSDLGSTLKGVDGILLATVKSGIYSIYLTAVAFRW